jgi:hypothetical protein
MKTMKKLMILSLVLCLTLALAGCAPKPGDALENYFAKVKSLDDEAWAELRQAVGLTEETMEYEALYREWTKKLLDKMEFEVGETTVDGNSSVSKVTVTAFDYSAYETLVADGLNTWVAEVMADSDAAPTEAEMMEEMMQMMIDGLDDPSLVPAATEISVNMLYDESLKQWVIQGDWLPTVLS